MDLIVCLLCLRQSCICVSDNHLLKITLNRKLIFSKPGPSSNHKLKCTFIHFGKFPNTVLIWVVIYREKWSFLYIEDWSQAEISLHLSVSLIFDLNIMCYCWINNRPPGRHASRKVTLLSIFKQVSQSPWVSILVGNIDLRGAD